MSVATEVITITLAVSGRDMAAGPTTGLRKRVFPPRQQACLTRSKGQSGGAPHASTSPRSVDLDDVDLCCVNADWLCLCMLVSDGEPLSCGYVSVCIGSCGLIVLTLLTIR